MTFLFGLLVTCMLGVLVFVASRLGLLSSDMPDPESWRLSTMALLPCTPAQANPPEPWVLDLLSQELSKACRHQSREGLRPLAAKEVRKALAEFGPNIVIKPDLLGRKLAVPWVVSCSVWARGPDVTVLLEVTSSDQGRVVAGDTVSGDMSGVEELAGNAGIALRNALARVAAREEPLFEARVFASDDDALAAFSRAMDIYYKSGGFNPHNFDMIAKNLEKALDKDPDLLPAVSLKLSSDIWSYLHHGDKDALKEAFRLAERLGNLHDEMGSLLQLCRLNDMIGETEKAVQFCEKASSLDPRKTPYLALTKLYIDLGRWEDAANLMERAIDSHPDIPWLYLAAARISADIGRLKQAEDMCRLAIEKERNRTPYTETTLWPRLTGAHSLMSRILFLKGELQEALEQAETELEAPSKDTRPQARLEAALVARLVTLKQGGSTDRFTRLEARALADLRSDFPGVQGFREAARIYLGLDDEQALKLALNGLDSRRDDPELLKLAAKAQAGLGRLAAARELAVKAIKKRGKTCKTCAEVYKEDLGRAIGGVLPKD